MAEMEFMNLDVEALREVLEDLPGEYSVFAEVLPGWIVPVVSYDVDYDAKEITFGTCDFDEEDD